MIELRSRETVLDPVPNSRDLSKVNQGIKKKKFNRFAGSADDVAAIPRHLDASLYIHSARLLPDAIIRFGNEIIFLAIYTR